MTDCADCKYYNPYMDCCKLGYSEEERCDGV